MNRKCSIILLILIFVFPSTAFGALPEVYGVFVDKGGKLIELRASSSSDLPTSTGAFGLDLIRDAEGPTIEGGNLSIILHHPQVNLIGTRVFAERVQRVQYAITNERGLYPLDFDAWYPTKKGINFRIAPIANQPSMVRLVVEGSMPSGVFVLKVLGALYPIHVAVNGIVEEGCIVRSTVGTYRVLLQGPEYLRCDQVRGARARHRPPTIQRTPKPGETWSQTSEKYAELGAEHKRRMTIDSSPYVLDRASRYAMNRSGRTLQFYQYNGCWLQSMYSGKTVKFPGDIMRFECESFSLNTGTVLGYSIAFYEPDLSKEQAFFKVRDDNRAKPILDRAEADIRDFVSSVYIPVPGGKFGELGHGTQVRKTASGELIAEFDHDSTKGTLVHPGIDIAANKGSSIFAIADGRVVDLISDEKNRHFKSLGYMVMVRHHERFDRDTVYSIYLHLDAPSDLEKGSDVEARKTIVGRVGSTGAADGNHVHIEVRKFKTRFLEKRSWNSPYNIYGKSKDGKGNPQLQRNFVDPIYFLTDKWRKDFAEGL